MTTALLMDWLTECQRQPQRSGSSTTHQFCNFGTTKSLSSHVHMETLIPASHGYLKNVTICIKKLEEFLAHEEFVTCSWTCSEPSLNTSHHILVAARAFWSPTPQDQGPALSLTSCVVLVKLFAFSVCFPICKMRIIREPIQLGCHEEEVR